MERSDKLREKITEIAIAQSLGSEQFIDVIFWECKILSIRNQKKFWL